MRFREFSRLVSPWLATSGIAGSLARAAEGDLIWSVQNPAATEAVDVAVSKTGDIFVLGGSKLVKLDANGAELWVRGLPPGPSTDGQQLVMDPQDNTYTIGTNLIETAALRHLEEEGFVTDEEMAGILRDKKLVAKLKKGSREIRAGKGRLIA